MGISNGSFKIMLKKFAPSYFSDAKESVSWRWITRKTSDIEGRTVKNDESNRNRQKKK